MWVNWNWGNILWLTNWLYKVVSNNDNWVFICLFYCWRRLNWIDIKSQNYHFDIRHLLIFPCCKQDHIWNVYAKSCFCYENEFLGRPLYHHIIYWIYKSFAFIWFINFVLFQKKSGWISWECIQARNDKKND